jgi:hypothetical protein
MAPDHAPEVLRHDGFRWGEPQASWGLQELVLVGDKHNQSERVLRET